MINRGGRVRVPFRRVPIANPSLDGPDAPLPELKYSHQPTLKECAEVKRTLGKATNFPPELVDIIMDFAEYWACSIASIDYSVTAHRGLAIYGGHEGEDKFLLRTEPLGLTTWHSDDPKRWRAEAPPCKLGEEFTRKELERFVEGPPTTLDHPFRKIVFDIVSRDQGWSHEVDTHSTYRHSWTWFDAGIDRFDKGHTGSGEEDAGKSDAEASGSSEKAPTTDAIRPIWPPLKEPFSEYDHQLHVAPDHMIQCNRVAGQEWQHHRVEWSCTDDIDPESSAAKELESVGRGSATGDGSFVRNLKVGDMVTVWGRARFPGWTNNVQKVRVEVYWAL
ncbi:hypothetical protein GGR55DRAFT_655540 [Xylaria sp. FL0064]|nr:hypothetical protein GGR55DRAFT_655540 [Xylaria sp. FL0064]